MFLLVSVILLTGGGVSTSVHAGIPTPPPPGSRLRDTVNEQPVRILLECILVSQASVCPQGVYPSMQWPGGVP